jgi:uncharacterized protein YnzC (UPF0291/DUF896 family)
MVTLPKLDSLPDNLHDGTITMRLEEGVPIFTASRVVRERIQELLDKEKSKLLTKRELEELNAYEDIDDYLSYLNRVVRNMLVHGTTHS